MNTASTTEKCLKYEPTVVTINGVVSLAQAYGSPNFGEDPAHDTKEPFDKLTVERPICVDQGTDDLEPAVRTVGEFQLVFGLGPASPQSFPPDLIGRPVRITGKLFHSITGHHHTDVLIDVTSIALGEAVGSVVSSTIARPSDLPKRDYSDPAVAADEMAKIEKLEPVVRQARACIRNNIAAAYQSGVYGNEQVKSFFRSRCFGPYSAAQHQLGFDDLAEPSFDLLVMQELASKK
jgi:hypothetical protein